MTYYDDILNVNAYLRQKMKNNLVQAQNLQKNYAHLDDELEHLTAQADEVLARAYALAAGAGVDVSDIAARRSKEPVPEVQTPELLVHLPADFNFAAEFEHLREEAHAAGFIDVHPEELLSAEEMARAQAFDASLDARFSADTGLTGKDIKVMLSAVAVRIVVYFVMNYAFRADTSLPIMSGGTSVARLMDSESILSAAVPFDVPDNKLFKRQDIVGFDKYLGPVLGVANFMTNTVTTFDFKSYAVGGGGQLLQSVSAASQILRPIFQNADQLQSQILSAVVREACVLNMVHMDPAMAVETVKRAIQMEKAQLNISKKARAIAKVIPGKKTQMLNNIAATSFINTLVTGIHAVQYNPQTDGDIELYAVRTNKILAYSNAMSMTINSIPAFLSEDLSRVDWGGVLAMCFSLFHSTKFWVDAKTNFLVSAYKEEIDKQMRALDQYFVME